MKKKRRPLILIIMDGWGIRKEKRANAVKLAKIPFFNFCLKNYPHSQLEASGESVGLPHGYQGNSEVGHLNIGAGRIVEQQLVIINKAIQDKSFYRNSALLGAVENCRKHNSTLHLMGLVQDQGVHAHQDHLVALLRLAQQNKLDKVLVHAFTDGRDTDPKSAMRYLSFVECKMREVGVGRFATVIGRYYSMDRDNRWNRIQLAYDALVLGRGHKVQNAKEAVRQAYANRQTDEFITPRIIDFQGVKDKDSIIFFNYRPDRARQLTHAFLDQVFAHFPRRKVETHFVCMTEYYEEVPAQVAFGTKKLPKILGEVLSKSNLRQLRIAETEKYAHVTFFFNGEIEKPFQHEERILVDSPKVATYDLQPEMSAYKIKDLLLPKLEQNLFDVIVLNFANPDMVGHTGKLKAAIKAVETVDSCVKSVVGKVLEKKGVAIVTADHGNCEEMEGEHKTSHTTNKVPFTLIGKKARVKDGKLCDIAPTVLEILGIKKPKEMTGQSLIK
jgi:2,3-bisphosphoglycerate-independent phosphoglycerate mutase